MFYSEFGVVRSVPLRSGEVGCHAIYWCSIWVLVPGDGPLQRMDCHVVSGPDVNTLGPAVVARNQGWEHELLRIALAVLT